MISREHELVLEMVRDRPALAADLLSCVRTDLVPPFRDAKLESGDLGEHAPAAYRADALVTLQGDQGPLGLIMEVQRKPDDRKQLSWPVYLATARARLKCPVMLLVFCPESGVAAWARRPIDLGHPGLILRPLVMGPEEVPVVTSANNEDVAPELAVLSAMVHGAGPDGEKVLSAMLDSVHQAGLGDAHYIDDVYAVLPQAARKLLEALLKTKDHEYRTDFARHYVGKGKAEGKAEAILTVLAARGIEVPEEARVRIGECKDLQQLEAWVRLASTAQSVDEIFDDR